MSSFTKRRIINSAIILSCLLFQSPAFGSYKVSSPKFYAQTSETDQPNPNREQSSQKVDSTGKSIEITKDDGSRRSLPIITGEKFSDIIFTAMYGAAILLFFVLLFAFQVSRNSQGNDKNLFLTEALPLAIEGITIVYIVIAILLFGVLGITSAEGSLSILSAISGYVLGKSQGQKIPNKSSENKLNKLPGEKPNDQSSQKKDESSQGKL